MQLRQLSVREEAEALVIRALDEGMTPKDIRQMIADWITEYEGQGD